MDTTSAITAATYNPPLWVILLPFAGAILAVLLGKFLDIFIFKQEEKKWFAEKFINREFELLNEFYLLHIEVTSKYSYFMEFPFKDLSKMGEYHDHLRPLMNKFNTLYLRTNPAFNNEESDSIAALTELRCTKMSEVKLEMKRQLSSGESNMKAFDKFICEDHHNKVKELTLEVEIVIINKLNPKLVKKYRKRYFKN